MTTDPVLREIVAHTRAVFPEVERILLFGSRARGHGRPDSDYDLIVVTPTCPSPTHVHQRRQGVAATRSMSRSPV